MTAIWRNDGTGWSPMAPESYPDEATLHSLVEEAPQLLPLAGSPQLVVLGREVQIGPGYADLVAIEPSGRVVVIEIKLARNAEARRAVIAQVLAYASVLNGMPREEFEEVVIRSHVAARGFKSIEEAVASADQEGSFDANAFKSGLETCLAEGGFRLVVVLDSAPSDLVRLAGYLETIGDRLTIDVIAVSRYAVGTTELLVPQRMDPDRIEPAERRVASAPRDKGQSFEGSEEFESSLEIAPASEQPRLAELLAWCRRLESERLVSLVSYRGVARRWTLLPILPGEGVGLVTVWNDGGAAVQFWRSVFERRAPSLIEPIEARTGRPMGQGTTVREFDDELLGLITDAYRMAASGKADVGN